STDNQLSAFECRGFQKRRGVGQAPQKLLIVCLPNDLSRAEAQPVAAQQGRSAVARPFQLDGRIFQRKGDETLEGNVPLRPKENFVRRWSQLQPLQQRAILEPSRNAPGSGE